ncbi:MAG: S8 family serine peptidase [Phycisphaerales bacterium]|nr:S8 family serine peptidase [Phycisphaerales bacterium]
MNQKNSSVLFIRTLLCSAGFALSGSALAQQDFAFDPGFAPEAGTLSLRTGTVQTGSLANILARQPGSLRAPVKAGKRYVLQFDRSLNAHQKALLAQAGVQLGDYLPADSYLADLSHADLDAVSSLGFVRWAGEWQQSWKLEPEIGTRSFESGERKQVARASDVLVQAYLFDGLDADAAAREISTVPGASVQESVVIAGMRTIAIRLPLARVGDLAGVESIRFVEELPEFTERSNTNTRWIVQTNVSNSTPLYTAGIRGEGQIIGIMDGGFTPSHCSFIDPAVPITTANTPGTFPTHRKVVAYNVTLVGDFHGTHVSGTAMGNQAGDVNDNTRGIAYNAKVCFRTYGTPVASFPIDTHLTTHANQGATVHTNSWGDDGTTAYNAICRAIDLFSYNREDNLVCFASTNLSALKNPENAKNVLAVGKSGGSGSQTGSCSTLVGPTSDGRRKPEVFAPGCSTLSSDSGTSCGTASATGTSMASPAMAGAASLIRQYFTDGFYPTGAKVPGNSLVPSGALLRAMLVNSAVDMTTYPSPNKLPPNTNEGFGRILLDNSIFLAGDARKLLIKDIRRTAGDALSTGSTSTTSFRVQSNSQILRITMAFTDAPATIPTSFAPVNNINLRVIDPSGNVYLGNVINATTGQSQTGGTADAINSIEHFLLNAPAVGTWRAEVVGATVNVGTQGFGLVITGDVASFNPCPADLNNDSLVDDLDFALFAIAYEAFDCTAPGMPAGCPADIVPSGFVDDSDFVAFAIAYDAFSCP